MKKLFIIIIGLLVLLTSCSNPVMPEPVLTSLNNDTALPVQPIESLTEEVRGVWIASVYNINFPSAPDLSVEKLKAEIDTLISTVKSLNLNTIFFQAHPSADSLYKSELFPVSKFLSTNGELYFDPLEYIIDKCHENDIKLHVWVNPLRVTTSNADSREAAISKLDQNIGAATTPEMLVYYADKKLYYNAGIPEVRDLITECVAEILANYAPDGIIFDDYFYPYPAENADFDDKEAYNKYGNGLDVADWRRNNINSLIKNVYTKIKELNNDCLFGVSPFGIWQNYNGDNEGSCTNGLEGYHSLYCDALTWAEEGYVDYLSPQLYWEIDSQTASYKTLCEWWNEKLDGTKCAFIPSLAAYRYDNDWNNPEGEMTQQIELGRKLLTYQGVMYYGFEAIKNNIQNINTEIQETASQEYSYYTLLNDTNTLKITSHNNGFVTVAESITLIGLSDQRYPLVLDGKNVSRYIGGKFEIEVVLENGRNDFEFMNGENKLTLTVFKETD